MVWNGLSHWNNPFDEDEPWLHKDALCTVELHKWHKDVPKYAD
jgi:hypothetical protein